MIELNRLLNREYKGRDCVSFTMRIEGEDRNEPDLDVRFTRNQHEATIWNVVAVVHPMCEFQQAQLYDFVYQIPSTNIPLPTVAASGLLRLQQAFELEVQQKSIWDFKLGDLARGM